MLWLKFRISTNLEKSQMVNPQFENDRRPTMFIAGNDAGAKSLTSQILNQFGWDSLDMGLVESARAIEPLCQLWYFFVFVVVVVRC